MALSSCLWCGCAHLTPPAGNHGEQKTTPLQVRNNAASLLHDLLGDEKNVSKVLVIKNASPDVTALVKMIAEVSDANAKKLELLATNDPELNLSALDLPLGEQAARAGEAKTKEHDLLLTSGANFEFNLLLTQTEALNYGSHLATVATENSTSPEEVQAFKIMSATLAHLYEQTILQMRALPAH